MRNAWNSCGVLISVGTHGLSWPGFGPHPERRILALQAKLEDRKVVVIGRVQNEIKPCDWWFDRVSLCHGGIEWGGRAAIDRMLRGSMVQQRCNEKSNLWSRAVLALAMKEAHGSLSAAFAAMDLESRGCARTICSARAEGVGEEGLNMDMDMEIEGFTNVHKCKRCSAMHAALWRACVLSLDGLFATHMLYGSNLLGNWIWWSCCSGWLFVLHDARYVSFGDFHSHLVRASRISKT